MNVKSFAWVFIVLILVIAGCSSKTENEQFVNAVIGQDFDTAWSLLSTYSQNGFKSQERFELYLTGVGRDMHSFETYTQEDIEGIKTMEENDKTKIIFLPSGRCRISKEFQCSDWIMSDSQVGVRIQNKGHEDVFIQDVKFNEVGTNTVCEFNSPQTVPVDDIFNAVVNCRLTHTTHQLVEIELNYKSAGDSALKTVKGSMFNR